MRYLIFAFLLINVNLVLSQSSKDILMKERIDRVKNVTGRILIDNIPVGTGFFIGKEGYIATCYHVIINDLLNLDSLGNIISMIEIEMKDKKKYQLTIPNYFSETNLYKAETYDYLILKTVDSKTQFTYIELGDYTKVNEGDEIYLCGYPFGIETSIVSKGMISTKASVLFNDSVYINGRIIKDTTFVEISYLDITMNKGNSGGPVLIITDKPENDKIIGISDFNVNTFAKDAVKIKEYANEAKKRDIRIGNNLRVAQFIEFSAIAIENNFFGIGGLISIEYLKKIWIK